MEEVSIEAARKQLGELVDRARLAHEPTLITRQGKPAAVIVNSNWHAAVTALIEDMEALEMRGDRIARQYNDRVAAIRAGRRAAGLAPQDRRVVHHVDGNPYNFDPSNLQIVDPAENTRSQP